MADAAARGDGARIERSRGAPAERTEAMTPPRAPIVRRQVAACRMDALQQRGLLPVTVDGREVIVALVDGRVVAYAGACLHQGGPLWQGTLDGPRLTCPWHGCPFDLRTGQMIPLPKVCLPRYETVVDGEEIHVLAHGDV